MTPIVKLAEQHGATHKANLGVYQFYEYEWVNYNNALVEVALEALQDLRGYSGVGADGNHTIPLNDHRPHGYFALVGGQTGLFQGKLHEVQVAGHYSHSMVAGGLDEMSKVTRLMPRTSLMMREDTRLSRL